MLFAILTILTALALAGVAGWFSIAGIMTIYAGAPLYALIMGAVAEVAKLVTTSWLYRNWQYSGWLLKIPLIFFVVVLMAITSIGVYGFLSKAHLDQNTGTLNNSARVEQLDQQILRFQATIDSAERTLVQLDKTLDSYLQQDRADRSVFIRRRQEPQRQALQKDIAAAQVEINQLNQEKFQLQSELRKLELEVGPIRYIAELMYGSQEDSEKNIESAVKIFTLLIVVTLDPLAIILLVAGNHTWLRIRTSGKLPPPSQVPDTNLPPVPPSPAEVPAMPPVPVEQEIAAEEPDIDLPAAEVQPDSLPTEKSEKILEEFVNKWSLQDQPLPPPRAQIKSPAPTRVAKLDPWASQTDVLQGIIGRSSDTTAVPKVEKKSPPKTLNWLKEFGEIKNEK